MRKYYLSHIDFSEIINVTADEKQINEAKKRMRELKFLTEKGNPSVGGIGIMTINTSKPFFAKLYRKMQRRRGGAEAVRDTLKKLFERKDYYGFYLYVAFLYGFLEWQVPEPVVLLPAVPEALKIYCSEFMDVFDFFLKEMKMDIVEEPDEEDEQTDI